MLRFSTGFILGAVVGFAWVRRGLRSDPAPARVTSEPGYTVTVDSGTYDPWLWHLTHPPTEIPRVS